MEKIFSELIYGGTFSRIFLPQKTKFGFIHALDPHPLSNIRNHNDIFESLSHFQKITEKIDKSQTFRNIHNFSWLIDINYTLQEEEKKKLYLYLKDNIRDYSFFSKNLWEISLLSERLFYALHAYPKLVKNLGSEYHTDLFFKMIHYSAIFLRNKLPQYKKEEMYILLLIRSALASICLGDERKYLHKRLKQIYDHIDTIFTPEAGHISRCASFQFRILTELIILRDSLIKVGISIPIIIQKIISKSSDYLEFLRHPDGSFSCFNGSFRENKRNIDHIFSFSPGTSKITKNLLEFSQFYRLQQAQTLLIADFKTFHNTKHKIPFKAHQNILSFELSVEGQPIFLNHCHPHSDYKNKIPTLQMEGIKTTPSTLPPFIFEKKISNVVSAITHKGSFIEGAYKMQCIDTTKKKFHLSHYRKITLHKSGSVVQGEDWVSTSKKRGKKLQFDDFNITLSFALAPHIQATMSNSGSVLLDIPNKKQHIFNVGSGKISLQKGYFLGNGVKQKTYIITVSLPFKSDLVKMRWALQEIQNHYSNQ